MPILLFIQLAADVYPTSSRLAIALPDELVEVTIHENREPFPKSLNVRMPDVARLALHVLGRVLAPNRSIESRAAISRRYYHWLLRLLSQWFKDRHAEIAQRRDELIRHCIVYAPCFSSGGACELLQCEMFC